MSLGLDRKNAISYIVEMKLLLEQELIWSDVVANNRMNRKRKASGVNSYEKELGFKPETFLNACLEIQDKVKWLDLCCGEGGALLQYAEVVATQNRQSRALLKGIDLVDQFLPIPGNITCLEYEVSSLVGWAVDDQYDLATCVHGLHYIGDKLKVLQNACKAIANSGLLIVNLDLKSIKVEGDPAHRYLRGLFKRVGIHYDSRRKIVRCEGRRELDIELIYQGANDMAGPNYTGQDAVDSYYAVKN